MPRVALPSRDGQHRSGLAGLWREEVAPHESGSTKLFAILSILATRLRSAPLAALTATISLCAVISLSSLLLVVAIDASHTLSRGAEQITIRVVPNNPEQAAELEQRLAVLPGVRSTRVIGKDEALVEFTQALGASKGLLDGIENDNPLPVTIELALKDLGAEPRKAVDALVERLHTESGVGEVVYNASLVSSLGDLLAGVTFFGLITIIAVLLIGSILVGMTIRLGVYAHRHEIEVMQLVGADRRHIQLPFVVEALSVGLLASVLSTAVVVTCVEWLSGALASSSLRWLVSGEPTGFSLWIWLGMLSAGPLLALLGALVALRLQGQR